jgi:hypothetical protein
MPFLFADFSFHPACLAAVAVVWAVVLVDSGMLLLPVQAAWRIWYRGRYASELDERWWFKLFWGRCLCCAGQFGFWGYLYLDWRHYDLLFHLYFTSLTILYAFLWRAAYSWSQRLA